ncbi:ATP-binding protein [Burkholderia gladioli]|uniref:ATP-binding protein n=1 Tax=Burkholderia gladioli TaxID=28095 RepID=UPI000F549B39|nr:ATP-binding protein [Burkholderia gladioli]
MATDTLRPLPIEEHPVVLSRYRIPTPSIAEFYALLLRCLTLRTGAMVYARSRIGKTYAILFLEALLGSQRPSLPILRMRCQHKRGSTETAFFSALLTMARHKASSGRDPTQLRQRLVQRLLEIADQANSNVILAFLDEAQHLTYSEFEWLRDIHDELEFEGVRVVTVFVGQPALRSRKSVFQRDGEEQIVARFLTEELPFHGVRSAHDRSVCLQGYDQGEYLENSGWNHTRFFFPRAYGAGMRLAAEGSAMWEALDDAHKRAQLVGELEIPMQFFACAVEHIFHRYASHDSENFAFSKAIWDEGVDESGYVRARK